MSVPSVSSVPSHRLLVRALQLIGTLLIVVVIANCGDSTTSNPPATQLVFTGQPTSATAGNAISPDVVVTALDADGKAADFGGDVTISIDPGTGTAPVLGATVKASNGVATFKNLVIQKAGTGYMLVASATGLTPAPSSSAFDINHGPAFKLAVTTQPSTSAANGAVFIQQPAVQLQDQFGNQVSTSGIGVAATIATGGGALGGILTATTDISGMATFTNLSITGTIGTRTLSFTSGTLTAATSNGIELTAGAVTQLTITTPPSATAGSGVALLQQPAIQLRDAAGNPVNQVSVPITATFASGSGTLGGATAFTDGTGLASFTNLMITGLVGPRTLSFGSGVLTPATSGTIQLGAGAATQLTVTTQPSATAINGTVFLQQPAIQLRDAAGNAVSQPGVEISAAIATGGSALSGPTALTDATGLAPFANLMLTGLVGPRTLSFTSPNLTAATSNTITLTAGAATQLTITTQPPATVGSGAVFGPQPAIQLRDASGNAASQLNVQITATIATGGGTLGGITTANTNASGLASFSNLSITGTPGPRTLSFGSGALTPVTSNSIDLTSGVATQLAVITGLPASAQNAVAFSPAPTIQLRDAAGNAVSQANVLITATIATGGGTLSGATALTDATGLATFATLAISGTIGNRTLNFTSPSLTPVNAVGPINITAGAATQLTITTQPQATVQNAVALNPQPVIQLRDAGGNAVSQLGVGVVAAIASGGGTLTGGAATVTVNTNASGVATFAGLSITGLVGVRTLSFSSGVLTAVTSGNIQVNAGVATTMAISVGNAQTATVSTAVLIPPAVLVTDVSGNLVSGRNVTFTVTGGGGVRAPAAAVASSALGIAAVTSWTMGAVAGTNTLQATSATPAPALTAVNFTATGTAAITGSIWVADYGNASIDIFAAAANGNVAPTATITLAGLAQPTGVVRDAAGLLYVSDYALNQITVYAAGATGNATPTRTIAGALTGLDSPVGIAVNAAGNIYVANQSSITPSVVVFAPLATGNVAPIRTITGANTGLVQPGGIVLDGDTLHVADLGGSILTFGPTATGDVVPLRNINGAATLLAVPWGLALDATGGIWAANQGDGVVSLTGSLTRYARGSNGDVAPTARIEGALTTINGPVGVSRSGTNLLVSNFAGVSVLVFPTTANGNVAPSQTISGATTGLVSPFSIAF